MLPGALHASTLPTPAYRVPIENTASISASSI